MGLLGVGYVRIDARDANSQDYTWLRYPVAVELEHRHSDFSDWVVRQKSIFQFSDAGRSAPLLDKKYKCDDEESGNSKRAIDFMSASLKRSLDYLPAFSI